MDTLLSRILWCLFIFTACCTTSVLCKTVVSCLSHERDALLTVKNELLLGGALAFPFLSWSGFNCCEWEGVQCSNLNSHVIQLHLSTSTFWLGKGDYWVDEYRDYWFTNERAGASLSPALLRLKYLEYLDLSYNELTGLLPPGFFEFKYLKHLDLSFNSFEGEIPKGAGSLLNLIYLNLALAGFDGRVQLGNLTHLEFLDISALKLYGPDDEEGFFGKPQLEISSLDWLKNLPKLKHLSLQGANVNMSGEKFGASLSHLSYLEYLHVRFVNPQLQISSLDWLKNLPKLKHLSLQGANVNMSGEKFGAFLSHLSYLEYLDVRNCGLSGPIPTSLLNLTSLAYLVLSYNMFSSQVPPWLGNMTALYSLLLKGNNLNGPLPLTLSSLPNLRNLQLCDNPYLSGDIGQILDGQWRHLTKFSLSRCAITGTLPSSIGNLSALETLDLSRNNLEGNVSLDSFQNNIRLQCLSLCHNDLTVQADPLWIPKMYFKTLSLASCNIGGTIPPFLSTQYRLQDLDLRNNSLVGSIPSWFEELKDLRYLKLSSNNLVGSIPSCFEELKDLCHLKLSSNNLVGSIPSCFEELKDLRYLNLSHNNLEGWFPFNINVMQYEVLDLHKNSLTGPLPIPLQPWDVQALDLSYNKFIGIIPKAIGVLIPEIVFFSCSNNDLSGGIPPSIGNMQRLQVLDVSRNNLSGTIPWSITNCSILSILNLANTNLTGYIPSEMGRLLELESMHLNGNMLVGNLPRSLLNCSRLQILDVGNNFLSGKIPYWLAGFSNLMILILAANQFQGIIPPELRNLSALHVLDISNNRLTGPIPRDLGKLTAMVDGHLNSSDSSYMSYYYKEEVQMTVKDRKLNYSSSVLLLIIGIDLSGNKLSGGIPSEFGGLKGLHVLNISRNNLKGKIPLSFGMMKQLESLDLSWNKLQGSIPPEMSQLTFLVFFNVSHNMLSGRIPTGRQFSTFNESFFVGNRLCGFPLNTCQFGKQVEKIPEEDDEGEGDGIPWHWYVEWMASFAAGFWGVFALIYVRQSWRRRCFQALDRVVVMLDGVVIRFMHSLTN